MRSARWFGVDNFWLMIEKVLAFGWLVNLFSLHRKVMVAVAQLVEPLIVVQVVAGSSPVGRPILFDY